MDRRMDLRVVPRTIVADGLPFTGRACGKMGGGSDGARTSRILRGESAQPGELCWQVAIFAGGEFLCGGALVTAFHVITSAHCVQKYIKKSKKTRWNKNSFTMSSFFLKKKCCFGLINPPFFLPKKFFDKKNPTKWSQLKIVFSVNVFFLISLRKNIVNFSHPCFKYKKHDLWEKWKLTPLFFFKL